ncbi:histidine kinase [Thiohalobacter sp. IOR34]|uniref:sensor histidine kinase n=1 Tax=Thiohalobacter sp. IOR34 TaxID=3057176 RepID=UPI0025AFF872|nr:histidine kinase [Thiohalobacter sp. IOR34]WJW75591.1 histidine kinase [Thiohalobacter sp. IOR34]
MASAKGHQRPPQERAASFFLPSFCGIRMVFAVVVVAELLAFVLVLAGRAPGPRLWSDLGLVSLFVQWVALSSAALLCLLRPWLARLSNLAAGLLAYLLLLATTAVLSEAAYRLLAPLGGSPQLDHPGFVLRNLAISAIISALLLRYFYVRHQWQAQVQAEARARIAALAARIRPHFLFNSLNTIASLTSTRPQLAEELVQDLADLFRVTMQDVGARISLAEEIDIARRYLHIESQRLGERLQVEWMTKNLPLTAEVPPLILQPLLENAVYHGIEPVAGGGSIQVLLTYNRGVLRLEVRNPLVEGELERHREGNRMALANIQERLRLAFGASARLETEQRNGEYRVRLLFPLEAVA